MRQTLIEIDSFAVWHALVLALVLGAAAALLVWREQRQGRIEEGEFGKSARLAARFFGPLLVWTIKREERRLARGRTYEPRTIRERTNWGPA